jgi:hypothetical protein
MKSSFSRIDLISGFNSHGISLTQKWGFGLQYEIARNASYEFMDSDLISWYAFLVPTMNSHNKSMYKCIRSISIHASSIVLIKSIVLDRSDISAAI